VCGSDLWPYRGIQKIAQPTPMGHEYCGIVEEVGSAVKTVKPAQFVILDTCYAVISPFCHDVGRSKRFGELLPCLMVFWTAPDGSPGLPLSGKQTIVRDESTKVLGGHDR
jgi:hypothetical protein